MPCLFDNCDQPVVKSGYCRTHWIGKQEEIYLDNSDLSRDKGIVKWAYDCLPTYVTDAIPDFHLDIYAAALSLFDPNYTNKYNRLMELISFRGSAKSTILTMILPSYLLAHNGMVMKLPDGRETRINEGLILILSETGAAAEDFTVRIRDEFTANEMLRYMYDAKIEDAIDNITGQWTRTAFKMNGCFVVGIGAKMQVRGKIKGASRPTLVIGDDIYSNKNTLTKEERRKTKNWWNSEVMNSVDDVRGKVLLCGTIVHEDTILVELERNDMWKKRKFTLMDPDLFLRMVQEHTTVSNDGRFVMKHDDERNELARITLQREYYNAIQTKSIWKERLDNYFMLMKYKEAYQNNTLSTFWQEYFHILIGEADKKFRKEYFQQATVEYFYNEGTHWIRHGDVVTNVKVEMGIDLAAGVDDQDDTVIAVVAVTPSNRRYVLNITSGKFAIRDVFWQDNPDYQRYNKVILDKSLVKTVGFIDEAFRLALQYNLKTIKIGIAGEERLYINEFSRVFVANGMAIYPKKRQQSKQDGSKFERIIASCLPYYETLMVYHCCNTSTLQYQLEYLGKAKHDDHPDALEVAFYELRPPSPMQKRTDSTENEQKAMRDARPRTYRLPYKPVTPLVDESWKVM